MATVRQHVRINRPVDEVWAVVTDAGALATWFPGMESSTLAGDVRECTMAGGFTVKEQIVTNDPQLQRLQYRIVEGVPLTSHLATIDVLDDQAGALVVYGADLEPGDGAQIVGCLWCGAPGPQGHARDVKNSTTRSPIDNQLRVPGTRGRPGTRGSKDIAAGPGSRAWPSHYSTATELGARP